MTTVIDNDLSYFFMRSALCIIMVNKNIQS